MKNSRIPLAVAVTALTFSSCDQKSADSARLADLERMTNEAVERQRQLQQQLDDQKLAAERDAIERERVEIEAARAELEKSEGDSAAKSKDEIRSRDEALAAREGKLNQVQDDLVRKESVLNQRGAQLSQSEMRIAGREALQFVDAAQQEPVADYGLFYDSLSSYGSWFETSDYGYVWQPVVVRDSNWRPYSRGRWICSDRGWTWVSDEPFGWATYHYGRWALLSGRGWVWVPGSEWAPCWVTWRESRSHIGWAPLPPETMAYRNQSWDGSVETRFGIGSNWFSFVQIGDFDRPLSQYCLPISRNDIWIGESTNVTYVTVVNRQVISGGPRYDELCERTGRQLPFLRLEIDQHPRASRDALGMKAYVAGNRLRVSAPNMDADWNEVMKPGKVQGRIETVTVERKEPLQPEIAERFRRNRDESRRIANRTVSELGGEEKFKERRLEQLTQNRGGVEERTQRTNGRKEVAVSEDEKLADRENLQPVDRTIDSRPAKPTVTDRDKSEKIQKQRDLQLGKLGDHPPRDLPPNGQRPMPRREENPERAPSDTKVL